VVRCFRKVEEPPKLKAQGSFSLAVPGYYSSKRALDRFGNCNAPELHVKNIAIIGMHPGMVATELVAIRVQGKGSGRQRRRTDDGSIADAGLFRRLRESLGIHRATVLAEREMAEMRYRIN